MGYQGFSPKLELAKAFSKAKVKPKPLGEAEKARRRELNQRRQTERVAENLAQRALIESRRT